MRCALSQGAADFVGKPYKPQIILHRVASIINLRETAAMVNQFKYDRLTGLYGKEYFYKSAKEYILKNPEKQYDIVCSDIENFKLINDVFGVSAGDALLCGIAQIYTRYVNAHGICSHFHADQFVCLMEHDGEYTDELFAQINAQINALTKVKNCFSEVGAYTAYFPLPEKFLWSRCATERCWLRAVSRDSMENIFLIMMLLCGISFCAIRKLPMKWRKLF